MRDHDLKLGRDVALKCLPTQFTSDPDRLARFEREARALAPLSDQHVAGVYDIEDLDDAGTSRRILVLELVEGETHSPTV